MWKNPGCVLTDKDFDLLRRMLGRRGDDEPMGRLLREKIDGAHVVGRDEVPEDVATLNSRVTCRLGHGEPQTRIITVDWTSWPGGPLLPVTTMRGLALLGLSSGQVFMLSRGDNVLDMLHLLEVNYQPENARRKMMAAEKRPRLRLVHGGRPDAMVRRDLVPEPDDPGPSAA